MNMGSKIISGGNSHINTVNLDTKKILTKSFVCNLEQRHDILKIMKVKIEAFKEEN